MGTSRDLRTYPRIFWDVPRGLMRKGEVLIENLEYKTAIGMRQKLYSWRKLINESEGEKEQFTLEELEALNAMQIRIEPLHKDIPKGICALSIRHIDAGYVAEAFKRALCEESRGLLKETFKETFKKPPEPDTELKLDSAIDEYLWGVDKLGKINRK
jgi:hypothetical protein